MAHQAGALLDEEEEHENHERYLITYADMITLLLALFIILFAIGQTDLERFERLREGIAEEFGGPVLEGGTGILDALEAPPQEVETQPDPPAQTAPRESGDIGDTLDGDEVGLLQADLIGLRESMGWTIDELHTRIDERGLVVVLDTDGVSFDSGSWELEDQGRETLASLFGPLASIDNDLILEGHTDDRPMTGGLTNWELSANRAGAVLRYLTDALGVAPSRLSAAGYAETRPVSENTQPMLADAPTVVSRLSSW